MPDVSFTELPGRRVLVRRFRPEDVTEFVAYRSDAEVARYQSWDAPYPPDEGERFVAQMMTAHPVSAYDLTCRSAYDLTCWFAGSLAG